MMCFLHIQGLVKCSANVSSRNIGHQTSNLTIRRTYRQLPLLFDAVIFFASNIRTFKLKDRANVNIYDFWNSMQWIKQYAGFELNYAREKYQENTASDKLKK